MLTVFFTTLNGAPTLERVLDAYRRLEAPPSGWQLVAIDNGSTDGTPQLLQSYARALPLTVVVEPRRGKNVALNSAIGRLDGDLAVFTDDDVLPVPGWLCHLRACADAHPDYDIFGGAIRPAWESPPPEWIVRTVPQAAAFGVRDGEDGPAVPKSMFGANVAIRSHLFATGLRFDEEMGPRPGEYAMGGETELLIRLTNRGHKAWFCRDAAVSHIIRTYQLEPAWLFSRARRHGRGLFRLEGAGPPAPLWGGVPRWMIRAVATEYGRYVIGRYRHRLESAFIAGWEMNALLGKASEARRSRKKTTSRTTASRTMSSHIA